MGKYTSRHPQQEEVAIAPSIKPSSSSASNSSRPLTPPRTSKPQGSTTQHSWSDQQASPKKSGDAQSGQVVEENERLKAVISELGAKYGFAAEEYVENNANQAGNTPQKKS